MVHTAVFLFVGEKWEDLIPKLLDVSGHVYVCVCVCLCVYVMYAILCLHMFYDRTHSTWAYPYGTVPRK